MRRGILVLGLAMAHAGEKLFNGWRGTAPELTLAAVREEVRSVLEANQSTAAVSAALDAAVQGMASDLSTVRDETAKLRSEVSVLTEAHRDLEMDVLANATRLERRLERRMEARANETDNRIAEVSVNASALVITAADVTLRTTAAHLKEVEANLSARVDDLKGEVNGTHEAIAALGTNLTDRIDLVAFDVLMVQRMTAYKIAEILTKVGHLDAMLTETATLTDLSRTTDQHQHTIEALETASLALSTALNATVLAVDAEVTERRKVALSVANLTQDLENRFEIADAVLNATLRAFETALTRVLNK